MSASLGGALASAMTAVAAVLLVPAAVFTLETIVGSMPWPRRASPRAADTPRPTVAVLMPAHDEAAGIGAAVAAVIAQLGAGDRLLVVADNCHDDTARLAAQCGATVVERDDPSARGKGHALAFGMRHLATDPPDVVVFVDADCLLQPGALDALWRECRRAGRPVQALYLMRAPPAASVSTRVAEFAWTVKNLVRPLGLARLRLPCQLTGSGMAFPWTVLDGATLATSHLVEDMQLGLALAGRGAAPIFCREALVTSFFPVDAKAVASQRTRWEHGHLSTIGRTVPRAVAAALRRGRPHLLAMALDVCVPPLTSMVLVLGLCWIAAAAVGIATGRGLAWVMSSVALGGVSVAVCLGWWRHGRQILQPAQFSAVLRYAGAKLPIYWRLVTRGAQAEWVRTERDDRADRP